MSKAIRLVALAVVSGVSATALIAGLPHLAVWLTGAEWGVGVREFVAFSAAMLGISSALLAPVVAGEVM